MDNIQNSAQLRHFRRAHAFRIVHAHLYAPREELEKRFKRVVKKRRGPVGVRTAASYADSDHLRSEKDIALFKNDADVRINTARTDGRDTLVRVAARLGLYPPPDARCVDVLVG